MAVSPGTRGRRRGGGRTLKRSERVALELVQDIVEGGLKSGDPLPMESELTTQYGLSRPSLREALRLLEFQGLIQVRPGPGAGTVVGHAEPKNLARTMVLYLHVLGVSYAEIFECWADTQAWLGEAAARNPDRELVAQLMTPFARPPSELSDDERTQPAARKFHSNIYELAGNGVSTLLIQAVDIVALDHVLPVVPEFVPDNMMVDHSNIAHAIIAGDGLEAASLMRTHIGHIVDRFRQSWPERVGGAKLEWRLFE